MNDLKFSSHFSDYGCPYFCDAECAHGAKFSGKVIASDGKSVSFTFWSSVQSIRSGKSHTLQEALSGLETPDLPTDEDRTTRMVQGNRTIEREAAKVKRFMDSVMALA